MMRLRAPLTALLALLVFSWLLAACGEDEPVVRVDLSKREDIAAAPARNAITYAYLPQYSHATSYGRHRLLVDYLERTTGLSIRQIFPDTFDEHVKMVERGEIDISFSNPFIYLQLAQSGARAFARTVEPSGSPDFRGQVITRSDNAGITSIDDCRGKSWIAVDPGSAGGFLFPLGLFAENGITRQDFSEIAFAPGPGGKQEKVVLAVHAGKYDIGSIREGTLKLLASKIDLDKIRIVAQTRPYPGWVYAAREGLDVETVEKISNAMIALDFHRPEDAAILTSAEIRGIIPARDHDYDPVRKLVRRLELE